MLKNSAPIGEEKPPLYKRSQRDLVYSYVEHHCTPGDLVYYSILHQFQDFCQNYTPDLKNQFFFTQCTIQFYTRFKTQGICHDPTCVPKFSRLYGFSKLFSYISGKLKSKRTKKSVQLFLRKVDFRFFPIQLGLHQEDKITTMALRNAGQI